MDISRIILNDNHFVNLETGVIFDNGDIETLTKLENAVLKLLVLGIGTGASKENLSRCWQEGTPSDKNIADIISKLRNKMKLFCDIKGSANSYILKLKENVSIKLATEITYDKALESRATKNSKDKNNEFVTQMEIDFKPARYFANCGKEDTIFNVLASSNKEASIEVTYEPNRLREEIPQYGGMYVLIHPSLNLTKANEICFKARSKDGSIKRLSLEVKPDKTAGNWMHEIFEVNLKNEYQEFSFKIKDFVYPETAEVVGEFTFVIKPSYFADLGLLVGSVDIAELHIK